MNTEQNKPGLKIGPVEINRFHVARAIFVFAILAIAGTFAVALREAGRIPTAQEIAQKRGDALASIRQEVEDAKKSAEADKSALLADARAEAERIKDEAAAAGKRKQEEVEKVLLKMYSDADSIMTELAALDRELVNFARLAADAATGPGQIDRLQNTVERIRPMTQDAKGRWVALFQAARKNAAAANPAAPSNP